MNLSNIEFLIQEAFTGIKRNGLMAFASISTIALSLGVLGAFALLALSANNLATSKIGEFQVAVFMVSDANRAKTEAVAAKIKKMSGIRSVEIRAREKEWADFKQQRPDFESAGIKTNVLPYAMDVKIADTSRTASIANVIRSMNGVDNVNDGREILGHVMALARVIKGVSIIGVLMLLITAVFIISNAIKLTLYARRREIRIMQLVGATNWFIRIPLIIEGIVFGLVGAFIAWILLLIGKEYALRSISEIISLAPQFSIDIKPSLFAFILLILGAAIGAAGSFVSIRKFLHD